MNRFFFSITLFLGFHAFSQSSLDSLNLEFASNYERQLIERSASSPKIDNFFELLLSEDSTYNEAKARVDNKKVDDFLDRIAEKANKYNDRKKVKYIFEKIHDEFFKKYELDAYFSDIFNTATYNCVTGTALYVYAFDYFNFPYQIKETPTHVFLVAFPKKHNIYVETTLPGKSGSYVPSENMVRKAVDELVELKMITRDHVTKVGYNKAFNDYYYGDGDISKKELIGIQYYNKAITDYNNEHYKSAYNNILKSQVFYQNEKAKVFDKLSLSLIIDNTDFKDSSNFKWFLAFANMSDDMEFLKYKLGVILSEDTLKDEDFDQFETEILTISDQELQNHLMETAYDFRADRYSKLQRHKKTLEYAEKIYKINPNNLRAKKFICENEIAGLAQKNINEDRLEDLNILLKKYPFMENFGIYTRYRIYLYSFLTSNNFHNNKSTSALTHLKELERLMNENGDEIDFSHIAVGEAYGAAGAYFYRNQQKTKAVEYLKRGLSYSPGNQNITRKLDLIKNAH